MNATGKGKGTGDPTDHSCSHAPTPETESQLSPADPSCGHHTIWRRQGTAGSGLPREGPEPKSRGTVKGQDRAPPHPVPAFSPAPTSEPKGTEVPEAPSAHLGPQTPELTAEGPVSHHGRDPLNPPTPHTSRLLGSSQPPHFHSRIRRRSRRNKSYT